MTAMESYRARPALVQGIFCFMVAVHRYQQIKLARIMMEVEEEGSAWIARRAATTADAFLKPPSPAKVPRLGTIRSVF